MKRIVFYLVIGFSLTLTSNLFAQTSAKSAKPQPSSSRIKARPALVSTDGAAVYRSADFDSEVLTYLSSGDKVVASIQVFPGAGGIGLFFKIRTSDGVKGYVTDIDLISTGSKESLSPLIKKSDKKKVDLAKDYEKEMAEKEPIYFTRFLGATVGRKFHKVKYLGKSYGSDLLFFGLRGSGPGTLFDGPPLDFNLLVSVESPAFYNSFAGNKPRGFMAFSDLLLQLPFWENKHHMFSYSLGLMALYSYYEVEINKVTRPTKEFRLGGEVGVGYSYLFKTYLFRVDYRYQFEKYQTNSYMFSVQKEY